MGKVVFAKTSCKSASAKLIEDRLEKAFDDHLYTAYDALYNDYGVTGDLSDGLFADKHEFQLDPDEAGMSLWENIRDNWYIPKEDAADENLRKIWKDINKLFPKKSEIAEMLKLPAGTEVLEYVSDRKGFDVFVFYFNCEYKPELLPDDLEEISDKEYERLSGGIIEFLKR